MKLETKRLILRKPRISDWKDIVEGVGDLELSKMMKSIPYPYKKKDAVEWLKKTIKKWDKKESYAFYLELKSEKKVIGCIGLEHIRKFQGTATTGSWINKKYWKKGYITEAKIAANDFAFNKLKLRRLNSSVFTDNIASNKTQQKMGYKLEGMRRKYVKSLATGKIKDENMYGLLKEDWKEKRKILIKELENKLK